ncbi:MAG: hypothetical protein ACI4SF_08170, partial [Oscillospiraceae bacterium]
MNMKKTIAAVAACAMAVSAMATTVSAVDEGATAAKSVHYDLTIKTKATAADLTFTLVNVDITGDKLTLYIPYSVAETIPTEVTVTAGSRTYKFNTNADSADYDGSATIAHKSALDADGNLVTGFGGGSATDDWVNDLWVYTIDLSTGNGKALGQLLATTTAENKVVTVTMKGLTGTIGQAALNNALIAGSTVTDDATFVKGAIALTDGTVTFNGRGVVTESEVKEAMRTVANTTSNTAEIIKRLSTIGSKSVDSAYVNVGAVINDMIANYDDVVFTFNTATDNVLSPEYLADKTWIGNPYNYPNHYVTGVPGAESWMGDGSFKSFPQHLYNLFGDEGTGYTYSDSYTFNNLFSSALIANNGYTMNQSTVVPFEYSATSVSFSWADMTGGNSFVSVASAITTLQLATSSTWYWDSMDITGYELAAEDASTEAGVEDDGADLDDEDVVDDDDDVVADDDYDVDDDVVDDDVVADDDVADDTADAPASNPATGNAPIALAVIPVA